MNDSRTRRIGHNDALYRQVNERIEDLNEAFDSVSGGFSIVCECGDLHCMEQIRVPRELYQRTRENPARFILKPGHEAQDVEYVVEEGSEYVVVEKKPGAARRFAEETEPRR